MGQPVARALLREGTHGVVVDLPRQLRLRQRVTQGPGSRAASVVMAFKRSERPEESAGGEQQVAGHADPQVLTIPRGRKPSVQLG